MNLCGFGTVVVLAAVTVGHAEPVANSSSGAAVEDEFRGSRRFR
jgi:hypothetical protein